MSLLRRFAAPGAVPIFAAVGRDARERVEDLSLAAGVEFVASPRHASVLLVAGESRASDGEMLQRLHDQLPHPRATLWWGAEAPAGVGSPVMVASAEDPLPTLDDLYRRLLSGEYPSERDLLPDEPPAPWRGRGDHGQGGEGMRGGTPYGRPMPMPPQEDLRDGLALDAYTVHVGPFLPQLPPGLVLELTLQGDVFQSASVVRAPLPLAAAVTRPFIRALAEPVAIADIERARAAHHLRCVARLLVILELAPWAERCRRAARAVEQGGSVDIGALLRALRSTGAFAAIPAGLGRLGPQVVAELGGPPLRAAGSAVDLRSDQPAYRSSDFGAITQGQGDVRARVKQWLDEAEQAVRLASASGACVEHSGVVESPWGKLQGDGHQSPLDFRFTDLLTGLEWGEAMLVIASFDVASLRRMASVAGEEPSGNERDAEAT